MTILCTIAFLLVSDLAMAHESNLASPPNGQLGIVDLVLVLGLAGSAGLHLLGTLRLWRHAGFGRGVRAWQVICFWLGWMSLVGALLSPLHALGQRLFTAHMIEHELLMIVAAPLLVLAWPGSAMVWGLPMQWRASVGNILHFSAVARSWRLLTQPVAATVLHGVALWAWHMPIFYNAVLTSDGIHWLQHLTFLLTALLFWWPLLRGLDRDRAAGVAVLCLFLTTLHTGLLGVLLTLSRRPWYPTQSIGAADWGLTPLEDQQLAGLVMWVPAGAIYTLAALALAAVWIGRSHHAKPRVHAF
jgi:putative membrane protein